MAILQKIKTQLTLVYDDGTNPKVDLKTIPDDGVAAIQRWLLTQLKADPADPTKTICAYADSATTAEPDIIKNLFTDVLLSRCVEYAAAIPSAKVIAAQDALRAAALHLENVKRKEAGLIDASTPI